MWRKPVVAIDVDGNETIGPERIDRARDAIAMVRTVIYFLSTLAPRARYADCKVLATELEKVTFERGGAREEELTYQQATAFISKALEMGPAARSLCRSHARW